MKIILASKSAFRKRALEILGLKFSVEPSEFDESMIRYKNPMLMAKKLSESKARKVADGNKNSIVIASDLFAVCGGRVYEKPGSKREAVSMIKSFSGKKMDIIAGLAVHNTQTKKTMSTSRKYTVTFRKLGEREIQDYVRRYPVVHCSAAMEGDALMRFARSVRGDYPFLTGIPMVPLIVFLRKNGVRV